MAGPEDSIAHRFDAYIVAAHAVVERGLHVPPGRDLVVGRGATIVGPVAAGGRVFLGKDVVVRGPVDADGDVTVGAHAIVQGDVTSRGFVVVQESATVQGSIACDGSARIVGGRVAGDVTAGGDIEVRAASVTRVLKAGGRIRSLPDASEDSHVRDP